VATTDLGNYEKSAPLPTSRRTSATWDTGILTTVVSAFASLRLTVVLFALSIFLVLAGTLAQIDHDIWFVVHEYFRTWIALIDLQVFFPRDLKIGGVFPFPGGWTLGAFLAANLLAAHLTRFKVTGTGRQLGIGTGLIAFGMFFTYAVIQSGLGDTVRSELSPQFSNGLWHALRFALGGGTLLLGYTLALSYRTRAASGSAWSWWLGTACCVALAAVTLWLFLNPEAKLDSSGLRIMWELIKGGTAGLILLAGCYLVFGKRAGIVLLHSGIALLMFSELHTGLTAQEARMQIAEGQTVSFAEDIRSAEFAIIDKSDIQRDKVTVVPASLLQQAAESNEVIEVPELPFAIRVTEYFPNAVTRLAQPGETTRAGEGWGAMRLLEERPKSTGAAAEQAVDLPAAYVELLSKDDKKPLGTYLLWALPSSAAMTDSLEVAGKPYEIEMRFKRLPKPYSVHLIDFRHDRYVGTETPKNFSSEVRLTDPANSVDRTAKIWMNNPLRYGGDTLYQADWDKETERGTVLQVVTNSGWMIPYVSCMLVATGMLFHFGLTFTRFAERKTSTNSTASLETGGLLANWKSPAVWVPAVIVLIFAGWVSGRARPPKIAATAMNVSEFGKLPLAYEGRIQPFDTLARNVLTVISGHGVVELEKESSSALGRLFGIKPKVSATKWLLDTITAAPAAKDYQVFRIENLDLLQTLGLEPRDGFRYSVAELTERRDETMKQFELAREVPAEKQTLEQKKVMELSKRIFLYTTLQDSFANPALRTDTVENLQADLALIGREVQRLDKMGPRAIPPLEPDQPWQIVFAAEVEYAVNGLMQRPLNAATPALRAVLDAYRADDLDQFNTALSAYQKIVSERAVADADYQEKLTTEAGVGDRKTAERLDLGRIAYEAYFNHFNPFVLAMALYLVCFVLAACSWLGWSTALNRSANWLLWFTFALHTYALVARIYISGRPPVTNLYSSAVFIGWAAVLFALVYEYVYRRGLGNLLAAIVGFPTLFIAYNLAGDGDTFMVLQAVLDTQFWLATHVVCITLGYSTTILAGMMGIVYVVMALWLNRLDDESRKQLIRMTYGTLCFATFFSFVGTVLGGLWADDSWGRFWGWDPKENGALIIVLWNALVLHARWGGMIAHRGLAILAIFGNIVTAWSWFGVNLMGVGLHSYGFTEGRVKWLILFVFSQLLVMALGIFVSTRASGGRESPANV